MNYLSLALITGLVATMVMDVWGFARRPLLGIPAADYRLVGRWVGHLARGRFHHESIAASPAVRGERAIGWAAHYLLGLVFAAGLLAAAGRDWASRPTVLPALVFGLVTVLVPVLILQPAMGSRVTFKLQSLVTHAVFGVGLYLGGRVAANVV